MSNKEIFKKVFDEKFNREKIKEEIFLKQKINKEKFLKEILSEKNSEEEIFNKNNNKKIIPKNFSEERVKEKNNNKKIKLNLILKWSLIPICLTIIISGYAILNNKKNNKADIIFEEKDNSMEININKIKEKSLARVDCDVKIVSKAEHTTANDSVTTNVENIEILENIKIPEDFNNTKYNLIYVNNEKNKMEEKEYSQLNNYNYIYNNKKNQRSINISFSNENKPIRDYFFTEENSEISKINNVELKIYNYEKSYFTEFIYKGYYFDIETCDITQEELINLLTSIIK